MIGCLLTSDVQFELDWFKSMVITASNDINEETILSLNEQGHKITSFGRLAKITPKVSIFGKCF